MRPLSSKRRLRSSDDDPGESSSNRRERATRSQPKEAEKTFTGLRTRRSDTRLAAHAEEDERDDRDPLSEPENEGDESVDEHAHMDEAMPSGHEDADNSSSDDEPPFQKVRVRRRRRKSDKEKVEKPALLPEDVELVMDTYHKISHEYRKHVSLAGEKLFTGTIEKMPVEKYQIRGNGPRVGLGLQTPFQRADAPPMETFKITQTNGSITRQPVSHLEEVLMMPRMQYWTLTEQNFKTEDEKTLSHIPFIGESEQDMAFGETLLECFEEGIHGTREGCGEYINDWILYHLLKQLQPRFVGNEERLARTIYEQFPNKLSERELRSVLPDLRYRFEGGAQHVEENADNPMHSYHTLSCFKCQRFDCQLHDELEGFSNKPWRHKRREPQQRQPECRRPLIERCGRHCYKQLLPNLPDENENGEDEDDESTRDSIFSRLKDDLDSDDEEGHFKLDDDDETSQSSCFPNMLTIKTEEPEEDIDSEDENPVEWRDEDVIMLRTLIASGGLTICQMAHVMALRDINLGNRAKTCRQIYEKSKAMPPLSPRHTLLSSPKKISSRDQHRWFRQQKWTDDKERGKVQNLNPHIPCAHPDSPCSKENPDCHCGQMDNLCNKFCFCGPDCKMRFPGCRCAPGNCRTKQCQCWFANWECDPDTCKNCCNEDAMTKDNNYCKNVPMQRGLQKRLRVGISQVAGYGCFIDEEAEKGEFISEYCGEVISSEECERRGCIYDKLRCSYIFNLNTDQVVDATRVGNLIRFANHSKNPNCYARVFQVQGDHRIGIFAKEKIERGQELFFDYSYNTSHRIEFVPKERQEDRKRKKLETLQQQQLHYGFRASRLFQGYEDIDSDESDDFDYRAPPIRKPRDSSSASSSTNNHSSHS